jgi:hypothetical protein
MNLRALTILAFLAAACEDTLDADPAASADAAPDTGTGAAGGSGGAPPSDAAVEAGGQGASGPDVVVPYDAALPDRGCTEIPYYADGDGDGFGSQADVTASLLRGRLRGPAR